MTFRARPTSNRPRTWDDRDRRTFLMNVGFGLTVIIALLLLGLAVGVSWYGDHLAAAATVNGDTISKDAYQTQLAINAFRIDYQTRRIRTLLTAGHIRSSDAQTRLSILSQRTQQASTIALEQLIDGDVMQQLATQQGVTITEADVDAHVTEEATTPELRHAWMIAVQPTLAAGESVATDAEKAAAKATAEQALSDLKAGKAWDVVAKAVSTDASKDQAGDLGFIDKNASLDLSFVDALQTVAKDTPTDVIEGADGVYRIGRVTEIVAPVVDASLQQEVEAEGISFSDFRAALRREVVRQKLSDAVLAQYLAPGPQREVQEIYMQEGQSETGPQAIRVRHILYSPNGDPSNASKVAADDPAWADAKARAEATYEKLKADPSQFDAIARAESDESAAATTGGKLPYFSTDDAIDPAFAAAIFAPGLEPGQLLPPVQSTFGWHVIQVMHGPTDVEWANKLKAQAEAGADFGALARDNSDKADAVKGGDLGWVGKGQLQQALEAAIFATQVGGISDPVQIPGDGVYLFKVNKEETRAPDADQKANLETSAFSTWYSQQKSTFAITRDASITTATN
jgi:parvulin-like peptidyl-prolyl isomerase